MRFDFVFGYIERSNVGQRAFQAVTDLDKHLAVLNEDKKHSSIAPVFLADAPCLCDALRVICNIRVALHLRKDRHHDLIGCFALKLRKLFVEAQRGGFGNHTGVIVEIACRFRRNDSRSLQVRTQSAVKSRTEARQDFLRAQASSPSFGPSPSRMEYPES